jgi:hypothetical protein
MRGVDLERRLCAIVVALALWTAACGPSGPVTSSASPAASGPVAVEVTDKTKGEIQAVLTAQHDALAKRDLKAYQATFDGQRGALRRCKGESFDIAGRQGTSASALSVVKVEPYGGTYARAWVEEGSVGIARYYFRKVEGKWIQSEPTDTEAGAEKKTTVSGIDIDYWAIDDDIIDALGKGTVQARDTVLQNMLSEVRKPFGIRFYPTRSLQGLQGCNVVGFHIPNAAADDKYIRFFRYWFTPDTKALSSSTVSFIQHEGLHWAQDQFSPGISARLDWWLVEGWPDYIGQSRTTEYKRSTICTTAAPTFKQLVDGPRSDLPDFPPEDAVRYYAFANTMVEYLYAQFGPDAYKQLLTVYKEGVDPNVNYPKVLKVTPDQFYSGWLAFAKKKYC